MLRHVAVLALDTSAAVAVALVGDDGAPLASRSVLEHRRHAELLAPMITDVLADARVNLSAVTAVVAGTGPAPFTGLRVGLVTARALALVIGVPVHGVCSLDAIAAQALRDLALAVGSEVLVVTDARRREVYWARYRVTGVGSVRVVELCAGPEVATAAAVAAERAEGAVVVGRGATLYPVDLPICTGAPLDPDPVELAHLALDRLAISPPGTRLPTEPLYLRRPDAVPTAERMRALG